MRCLVVWANARGESLSTSNYPVRHGLYSLLLLACGLLCACDPCPVNDDVVNRLWHLKRIDVVEESAYLAFQEQIDKVKEGAPISEVKDSYIGYIAFHSNHHFNWNLQGLDLSGTWKCNGDLVELETNGFGGFMSNTYRLQTFEHYVLPGGISLSTDEMEFVFFEEEASK